MVSSKGRLVNWESKSKIPTEKSGYWLTIFQQNEKTLLVWIYQLSKVLKLAIRILQVYK